MGENYFMTTDNVIAIIQQQFGSFSAEHFAAEHFSFRINSVFWDACKRFHGKKVLLVDISRFETMNGY